MFLKFERFSTQALRIQKNRRVELTRRASNEVLTGLSGSRLAKI